MDNRIAPSISGRATDIYPSLAINAERFMGDLLAAKSAGDSKPRILNRAVAALQHEQINYTHEGYLGFYNSATPADLAAVAKAEFGLNAQAAAASEAPLLHDLELNLIDFVGKSTWPDATTNGGVITSGGASSNLLALVNVLQLKFGGEWQSEGIRSLPPCRLYLSNIAHTTLSRAARFLGLGSASLRVLPRQPERREEALSIIKADMQAGYVPVAYLGTVGDSLMGEADVTTDFVQALRDYDVHVHIDAAWAGSLLILKRFSNMLNVLASADSVTIDLHKWPGLPLGTSLLLVHDVASLRSACTIESNYGDVSPSDLADAGLEWSRQARSLSAWWRLVLFQEDFEKRVERHFSLSGYLRGQLRDIGWQIVNDTLLPVVCFTRADLPYERLRKLVSLAADNQLYISCHQEAGQYFLRAGMVSDSTSRRTLDRLVSLCAKEA